jgi:hypothetical protein
VSSAIEFSDNFILVSSAYEFSDNLILVSSAYEFSDNLILVSSAIETRKNCFRYLKLMSPLNTAICTTISYTWVEWYYSKNNYLILRSKVKVPQRSLWYVTHRLMVMHSHTKYHWPISKDKKCYGPDKKILLKKQLFDLEVKGQGPTKVITVCDTPPYGHAPTYQI